MKLKYKAPLIVFVVTLLTSAIATYVDYSFHRNLVENAEQKELKEVASFIQNDIVRESHKVMGITSLITTQPWIIKAFKEGNKDLLTSSLTESFALQKNSNHINTAKFWHSPATVFLNLYNPKDSDKDESSYRSMVLAANLQKQAARGIEVGSTSLAIRGVEPIVDGDEFIGSFEVGTSFALVLKAVQQNLKFHAAVFVEDDVLSNRGIMANINAPEDQIAGYRLLQATDSNFIKNVVSSDLLSSVNDIITKTTKIQGKNYGIVLVPLLDYTGVQIGSIVAARNFSELSSSFNKSIVADVLFCLVQSALLSFITFVTFSTLVISPLQKIRNNMKKLINGDMNAQDSVSQRKDTIGKLERTYFKLKNHLKTGRSDAANTTKS